jgi:hypothetical protein
MKRCGRRELLGGREPTESPAIPGKPDRGVCLAGGRSHDRRLMQENRYAMAQETIAGEFEEGED